MEMVSVTPQMVLTFAITLGAIAAYSYDRIPLELSAISTIVALLLVFQIMPLGGAAGTATVMPRDLLAGFADPALITILALLVVGQGLVQTGALAGFAGGVIRQGERRPRLVILGSFVFVMLLSAVLNNTPVVVLFIPILAALAEKLGKSSSRVMMPLSFIAILGGNLTLIGSSTNLLAAGALTQAGGPSIGFFDFTLPGMVLALAGGFYITVIMPRFLQREEADSRQQKGTGGRQFVFQFDVDPGGRLEGQKSVAGLFPGLKGLTIQMIQRGRDRLLPPYDDVELRVGDTVLVAATRNAMTDFINSGAETMADAQMETGGDDDQDAPLKGRQLIAEAVIAPASRMDGRTLAQSGFRAETGCAVIGVQRRSRMVRAALTQLRLEAGDVLLVMGTRSHVMALRDNRDVLLMESSATDVPQQELAGRALLVFLLVVALASSGLLPIVTAALCGAAAMLALRCLNIRQAGRAIDRRVVTIVAAALALGTAMQATGGASFIAHSVIELLRGAPIWVLLSGFFLTVALLTNMLSNNATAVLFTPIGYSIATELDVAPIVFMIAVIFGANCSFATPMSYQTNLLVMGPGHYRFSDFIRAGTPLIFFIWLTFTIFVPWYYGLL